MSSLDKVGRVGKAFGREGELLITLYSDFPEEFDTEEPLFVNVDSLAVPLFLEEFERRGKGGALVKFADFDTASRASELIGKELFLQNSDIPYEDKEEIYFEDLVGYAVSFDDRDEKGTIVAYIDNELNPIFEISVGKVQIYVPAVEEMISSLDTDEREIEFSLPEGLIDLYL